jgi:hypothetical protein
VTAGMARDLAYSPASRLQRLRRTMNPNAGSSDQREGFIRKSTTAKVAVDPPPAATPRLVATRKLAPTPSECWIVAEAVA